MRTNYSAEELSNIARLKELRELLNFSIADMERITGLDGSILRRLEKGQNLPFRKTYNKLAAVFGWKKVNIPPPKRSPVRMTEIPPAFSVGCVYSITSHIKGKRDTDTTTVDTECLFRFEGKQGELLRFTEIHGGWTLTYAPYQLIGKKIKEIKQ